MVTIFVDLQDVAKACKIQQAGDASNNGQSSGDSDSDSADDMVCSFTHQATSHDRSDVHWMCGQTHDPAQDSERNRGLLHAHGMLFKEWSDKTTGAKTFRPEKVGLQGEPFVMSKTMISEWC